MRRQHQLSTIADALRAADARVHRLADRTGADRWNKRHDPARWSVAECVAHLNLTSRAFIPRIDAALAEARTLGITPGARYRHDAFGWMLSKMVGPMIKVGTWELGRVKTPPPFVPHGDLPQHVLLEEFARDHATLVLRVEESNGLPIDRVRLVSPFDARVKYSLYSALVMIPRHDERHLIQAERVWGAD